MRGATVEQTECHLATIHRHRTAEVIVQHLQLPATGDSPPLGIERTVLQGSEPSRAIILVHGFAQNRFSWHVSRRSMTAFFAAEGFEVLNLELRGHGLSRTYGAPSAQSLEEYVDDLVRVVDACECPPFVMGHSLGGGIGVGASTRTHLAGLVHLAGVYKFGEDNLWLKGLGRAFLKAERPLKFFPIRMSTRWFGEWVAPVVGGADLAMHILPIAGWVPKSVELDLIQERIRNGFDWISVEIWLEMARLSKGEPFQYQSAFQNTDVPLLVIAGDKDKLLSAAEARACFEESGSTDKTYRLFEKSQDGYHWGHLDLILGRHAPEIVWAEILSWIQERL